MENDRVPKRVYVGKCAGSCSVGRARKRWIDTIKDCFNKEFGCQTCKKNGVWGGKIPLKSSSKFI